MGAWLFPFRNSDLQRALRSEKIDEDEKEGSVTRDVESTPPRVEDAAYLNVAALHGDHEWRLPASVRDERVNLVEPNVGLVVEW